MNWVPTRLTLLDDAAQLPSIHVGYGGKGVKAVLKADEVGNGYVGGLWG